jgi:hypothetical protein
MLNQGNIIKIAVIIRELITAWDVNEPVSIPHVFTYVLNDVNDSVEKRVGVYQGAHCFRIPNYSMQMREA